MSSTWETLVKNRLLGFLIWETISSATTFLLFKTLPFLSPFASPADTWPIPSLLLSFLYFVIFLLSNLLFSASLYALSSPQPLKLLPRSASSQTFRRFLLFFSFIGAAAVSGFLSLVSLTGGIGVRRVGIRGFASGLVYSFIYVYKRRWVLEFPIIQRPLFFSFKMGISPAIFKAFKLTNAAHVFSSVVLVFLPRHTSDGQSTLKKFVLEQIVLYIGSFVMFLCWELSHLLHQVLHTKRFVFAPPKGSAAAETNPSEPLLAALEESSPGSLVRYLAYLDLCMVCENNVDTWRRAAFFEETGETYKRVIAACLRPLEQLSSNLVEGLEGSSVDKAWQLSDRALLLADSRPASNYEPLNNFQQCAWSARAVASLAARSHTEDRFGVAQLSGSNAAVISTLLSGLLAVEAFMGKKTNLQPPNRFMGAAGIKWATPNTRGRDVMAPRKKGGPLHAKAYVMADVLRTSIYCIVSAFHGEMLASAKAGLLEKDWVTTSGKPLFGSRELLLQKLRLFIDFRAS